MQKARERNNVRWLHIINRASMGSMVLTIVHHFYGALIYDHAIKASTDKYMPEATTT